MARCRTCPWPNWKDRGPCLAEAAANRRYCDLADPSFRDHHARYRDWLRSGEAIAQRDQVVKGAIDGAALSADYDAELRAAEMCEHRSIEGCGCGGAALCLPGGKRAGERVSILECLACVRANS